MSSEVLKYIVMSLLQEFKTLALAFKAVGLVLALPLVQFGLEHFGVKLFSHTTLWTTEAFVVLGFTLYSIGQRAYLLEQPKVKLVFTSSKRQHGGTEWSIIPAVHNSSSLMVPGVELKLLTLEQSGGNKPDLREIDTYLNCNGQPRVSLNPKVSKKFEPIKIVSDGQNTWIESYYRIGPKDRKFKFKFEVSGENSPVFSQEISAYFNNDDLVIEPA
jgi:hypothetical protein